jgi:hypothetical protein
VRRSGIMARYGAPRVKKIDGGSALDSLTQSILAGQAGLPDELRDVGSRSGMGVKRSLLCSAR